MRILLIEDDNLIGNGLQIGLIKLGFAVDWFTDGKTGMDDLTTICEEIFSGEIPTEVQINDWLWFDSDFIYQALGYEDLLEN